MKYINSKMGIIYIRLIQIILFLFASSFFSCSYKFNQYSDRIIDTTMFVDYQNDSLKFKISFAGDFKFKLKNRKFIGLKHSRKINKKCLFHHENKSELLFTALELEPDVYALGIFYPLQGALNFEQVAKNELKFCYKTNNHFDTLINYTNKILVNNYSIKNIIHVCDYYIDLPQKGMLRMMFWSEYGGYDFLKAEADQYVYSLKPIN
jgi:hypothetical protein